MGPPIFWDVDTQWDFIRPEGALPVPGAPEIVPALARLTAHAHARGIRIVASADDHRPGDAELSRAPDFRSTFPPHCLHGTPGQAKLPETALLAPLVLDPDDALEPGALIDRLRAHRGDVLLLKRRFDVFSNPHAEVVLEALAPARITLYGVALDVCSRHAVEGLLARRPDLRLAVVTDASRAIDAERGRALLARWKARGVALVTTDEVVESARAPA